MLLAVEEDIKACLMEIIESKAIVELTKDWVSLQEAGHQVQYLSIS